MPSSLRPRRRRLDLGLSGTHLVRGASFSPLAYGPTLWLDAAHAGSLLTDGAANFTAASNQSLSRDPALPLQLSDSAWWAGWLYLNSLPAAAQATVLAKLGGSLHEYWLFLDSSGNLTWAVWTGGSNLNVGASTPITTGGWYFVLAWYDAALGQTGVSINNGTPDTRSFGVADVSDSVFSAGANAAGAVPLDGRLDSLAFGKSPPGSLAGVLGDIGSTLYGGGSGLTYGGLPAGKAAAWGLAAWWDLNEPSGVRHDRSGNSNDLTDNNGVGLAAGIASGAAQYDGDPVTTWLDRSGVGNHVTQATASKRPTLKLAVQNGRPVLRFDGVDDVLDWVLAGGAVAAHTLFIVINSKLSGSDLSVIRLSVGATEQGITHHVLAFFFSYHESGGQNVNVAHGAGWTQLTRSWNGGATQADMDLWTDGVASASKTGTPSGINLTAAGHLGAAANGFGGDVAEVVLYGRALTTAQRQAVEAYLRGKWGTP